MFRRLESGQGSRRPIQSTNIRKYLTRQKSNHSTQDLDAKAIALGMLWIHTFDENKTVRNENMYHTYWMGGQLCFDNAWIF